MLANVRSALSIWRVLALSCSLLGILVPGSLSADDRLTKAKDAGGTVTWYSSVYPDELRSELIRAFTEETGLTVDTYVGGTGQILSRLEVERQTGSFKVDVLDLAGAEDIEKVTNGGLFRAYEAPGASQVPDAFKDPEARWHGLYFWAVGLEYNTNLFTPETAPKSFDQLTDPRFKAQLVISDPARSAAGLGFMQSMVDWKGWDWVEQLMANDPLVVAIGPGVHQAVVQGERGIGATVTSYTSKTLSDGGPVALGNEELLFSSPEVVGVLAQAANPSGAELLVDFLLSETANQLYRKFGWFPARRDVEGPYGFPPADQLKLRYVTAPRIGITRDEIVAKIQAMQRSGN